MGNKRTFFDNMISLTKENEDIRIRIKESEIPFSKDIYWEIHIYSMYNTSDFRLDINDKDIKNLCNLFWCLNNSLEYTKKLIVEKINEKKISNTW